jgi:hypothetical protein
MVDGIRSVLRGSILERRREAGVRRKIIRDLKEPESPRALKKLKGSKSRFFVNLWWNRSTWRIFCDALAGLLPMVRPFPGALPQADMLPAFQALRSRRNAAFQALRSRCNVALLHHDLRRSQKPTGSI